MTKINSSVASTISNMVDFGDSTHEALIALCAALVSIVVYSVAASVFGIVSPVLALVSYYFCWKGGPWKNAIILCGLSSVLILGTCIASSMEGLILFLIGMFVTFMLYRDKDTFAS